MKYTDFFQRSRYGYGNFCKYYIIASKLLFVTEIAFLFISLQIIIALLHMKHLNSCKGFADKKYNQNTDISSNSSSHKSFAYHV